MDTTNTFCFIILHYKSRELTENCLNSFDNLSPRENQKINIVVIDNGSGNGSFEQLHEEYNNPGSKCHYPIFFLNNPKNLGFSKANNLAYRYALDNLHPDYVCIINNDTEICQSDFLDRIQESYRKTNAYVIGPDILGKTEDNKHQSPMMTRLTRKYICEFLVAFSNKAAKPAVRAMVPLPTRLSISAHQSAASTRHAFASRVGKNRFLGGYVKKTKAKRRQIRINEMLNRTAKMMDWPLLQGAAIIFTPNFVKTHELPFSPATFLYFEEEILLLRCLKNNWLLTYQPNIKIIHLGGGSTGGNKHGFSDFQRKCYYDSAVIALRYGDSIGWPTDSDAL